MSELSEHIKRVHNKLQVLLRQNQVLLKEKEALELSLKQIKLAGEKEMEENIRLQHQVFLLKSSVSKMEDAEKKEFEKQLNHFTKQIDKCINLLSE